MTEYGVIVIVVAMITTAVTIGAPIIKLNTAITRLIVKLDSLGKDMDDLEVHNHESHRRLWDHNDKQDKRLEDHESRLKIMEIGKEREE